MQSNFLVILIFLVGFNICKAQEKEITIELSNYVKDDRFDKYQITLALFLVQNDTIMSMDFENMRPAKPIVIKKPSGYKYCSYGYIFFKGSSNDQNPGYVTVLVCNPYNKNPLMFVDLNQDFDFTNDPVYKLPYLDEPGVAIDIKNQQKPEGSVRILLTRTKMYGKGDLKKHMQEYYEYFYKGRKFIGIEYTYREQRYITRGGIVRTNNDSFRIALNDGNSNGIYNDLESDKAVIINYSDSIFDCTNELAIVKLSKEKMYFEKNGKSYEILECDSFGKFIKIKPSSDNPLLGKIKVGKKIPKFSLILWNGEKLKTRKLRKFNTYFYFVNKTAIDFEQDTMWLRKIAQLDTNKLKVVCVLYVDKSYELRIFGNRSNANYHVALGHRTVSRKLGINSIPTSIWTTKKRRVKKYGIKPEEFYKIYVDQMK